MESHLGFYSAFSRYRELEFPISRNQFPVSGNDRFPDIGIADSVSRATHVFSLASVGHVTGHRVSHIVPIARCRPPYWKIFTVNNLATVF